MNGLCDVSEEYVCLRENSGGEGMPGIEKGAADSLSGRGWAVAVFHGGGECSIEVFIGWGGLLCSEECVTQEV